MNSDEKVTLILNLLTQRKAHDVVKIDVRDKTSVADFFVVASGRSTTQVKSLSEFCEDEAKKNGIEILRTEGMQDGRWAIVDFGDVILHIFNDDYRLFYSLESMWGEGEKIENKD